MDAKRYIACLPLAAMLATAALSLMTQGARADEPAIASGQKTNGKARADILSLKRTEGDTLTLRFAVVNEGSAPLSIVTGNLNLVDLVNRRTYGAGLSSSQCVAEQGQHVICWAVFAAPNAGVKTINVEFYEDFGLISTPISD